MDKKKNSNEILFRDGSLIPVTENLVLYAVWVPEEEAYTVSFDLQGGLNNGMPEKLSCLPGQSVLLPPLSNTYKEGFVRLGYSRDGTADSGLLREETEYFPTSDTKILLCGVTVVTPSTQAQKSGFKGFPSWKTTGKFTKVSTGIKLHFGILMGAGMMFIRGINFFVGLRFQPTCSYGGMI